MTANAQAFQADSQIAQRYRRYAAAFEAEAQQNVFGPNRSAFGGFGFTDGELQGFAGAWGEGKRGVDRVSRLVRNQAADFRANCFAVHLVVLERLSQGTPRRVKQAQQNMLGANEIMPQAQSFLSGNLQGPPCVFAQEFNTLVFLNSGSFLPP